MTNQHSTMRTLSSRLRLLLLALLTFSATQTHAEELAPVTGASFNGQQIVWNPLEGATGYNVYRDFVYYDTVVGVNSYIPDTVGRYSIAAFDSNGNYSPWVVLENEDNVVQVNELLPGVNPPMNVNGIVYSSTAGEVFWDRLFSRSLNYQVFLNGVPVGSTSGSSFFLGSLSPNAINLVTVIARTLTGTESEQVVLEFNTQAGPFPDDATVLDNNVQALRPDAPQNVRITLYSKDTAEIFWDRPPISDGIVATDVYRDGELLATTDGISYYDANGVFSFNQRVASPHKYELVAIHANGGRSLPAVINPGAFDGPTQDVVRRLLAGVNQVTTNNAHVRWFPFFQDVAFGNVDGIAEEVNVISTVEDGVLQMLTTEYNCTGEGTITAVSAPTAIINTTIDFDGCFVGDAYIDGEFRLNGLDAGGYTATYIDMGIGGFVEEDYLDGVVEVSVSRGFGSRTISYQDFRYSTFAEKISDDGEILFDTVLYTIAFLNQQVSDTVIDEPRRRLTTNFTVNASWTNGRDVNVTTTSRFENPELDGDTGKANYTMGELRIDSVREDDSLVLSVDTGDVATWSATVSDSTVDGMVVNTITGAWADGGRLPCVSAFNEDEESSGCGDL